MCNGFGAIVSNELNVYFCEPDTDGDVSHSEILGRLEWKDNTDQHVRRFVRVECADWTMGSFKYDEDDSLPGWVEYNDAEIRGRVSALLAKVSPAYAEYQKVRDAALDEYQKVSAPAWAEYVNVRDAARATMVMTMSKAAGYVAAKE